MTKSSDGVEMTAKEEQEELAKQKVRNVHPCAFRSAKGTIWSERGMTKIRLGKNWQNAVESLPAQAEPKINICHYHNGPFQEECPLGGKCERIEDWGKPVESLPVEAKGYELCDNCGCPISEGPQGWVHEDSDQMSCERAEPKPTLSTPSTKKQWQKNLSGVKDSIDCYRTIAGKRYISWGSCVPGERIAAYRKVGIKCRRLGEELFVIESDKVKVVALDMEIGAL